MDCLPLAEDRDLADDRPVRALPDMATFCKVRLLYTDGTGVPVLAKQQSLPFGLHFLVSLVKVCLSFTTRLPFGKRGRLVLPLSK